MYMEEEELEAASVDDFDAEVVDALEEAEWVLLQVQAVTRVEKREKSAGKISKNEQLVCCLSEEQDRELRPHFRSP